MGSIRDSRETWKLLRQIAAQEQRPMSSVMDEALRAYRRELLWRRAEADYARLAANEEQFRSFQDEIALWDSTSSDGLDLSDSYKSS
jgi:predicted transcriptional regulator